MSAQIFKNSTTRRRRRSAQESRQGRSSYIYIVFKYQIIRIANILLVSQLFYSRD